MRPFFVQLAIALCAALPLTLAAQSGNPRLASLQIEIWPEYDRPQNLVILKGELGRDARLPAALTLRIPATAGAPTAVAYVDASGKLLNLPHQSEAAGPFVLVRLTTPQPTFHVEFYDALNSNQAQREYRYAWPGDFAVERLSVLVKEPAAARNVSTSPELPLVGTSPDGLKYRAGDFGALKSGDTWLLAVRYTIPGASSWRGWAGLAAVVLALAGVALFVLWWRRPGEAPGLAAPARALCPKCGRATATGDRFCAGCGAALRKNR